MTLQEYKSVFTSAADWQFNACVNWGYNTYSFYAWSYYESANQLVKSAIKDRTKLDVFVYPATFLFRHYIELSLKGLIGRVLIALEKDPEIPMHHRINQLWLDLKKIYAELKPRDPIFNEIVIDFIDEVIKDFSEYDPDSFANRYPVDKKGKETLDGVTHINIRQLGEVMIKFNVDIDMMCEAVDRYIEFLHDIGT